MNSKERFVITISRQFGTGGHEIGMELARRLGVKLLDKQILNAVASRMNAVEEAVEKIELRNPLWRDDFTNFYRTYMAHAEYNGQEKDQTSHALFVHRQRLSARLPRRSRASSSDAAASTSLPTSPMR